MPALPFPKYGLEHLYLFPRYESREAYRRAAGAEAPPYDPKRPLKCWCDPQAANSTRRNVVYDHVIATNEFGDAITGPDGRPVIDILVLPREDAATVNLPDSIDPRAKTAEVPMPLRALEPNEELFFDLLGEVNVRNIDLLPPDAGFTARDRALLHAIARKLGL